MAGKRPRAGCPDGGSGQVLLLIFRVFNVWIYQDLL